MCQLLSEEKNILTPLTGMYFLECSWPETESRGKSHEWDIKSLQWPTWITSCGTTVTTGSCTKLVLVGNFVPQRRSICLLDTWGMIYISASFPPLSSSSLSADSPLLAWYVYDSHSLTQCKGTTVTVKFEFEGMHVQSLTREGSIAHGQYHTLQLKKKN